VSPQEACRLLGVEPPQVAKHSPAQARASLDDWKTSTLRVAWRALVARSHPDRATDEDDRRVRTAHTAKLNAARDRLMELQVVVRQKPRPSFSIRFHWSGSTMGTATNTTTTTGDWWRWG